MRGYYVTHDLDTLEFGFAPLKANEDNYVKKAADSSNPPYKRWSSDADYIFYTMTVVIGSIMLACILAIIFCPQQYV